MGSIQRIKAIILVLALAALASACKPEVGTEAWCEMMDEKAKGDWTANEVGDYAKHCIMR
jgi:hypothetical protein